MKEEINLDEVDRDDKGYYLINMNHTRVTYEPKFITMKLEGKSYQTISDSSIDKSATRSYNCFEYSIIKELTETLDVRERGQRLFKSLIWKRVKSKSRESFSPALNIWLTLILKIASPMMLEFKLELNNCRELDF